jgi:hypothetical protein
VPGLDPQQGRRNRSGRNQQWTTEKNLQLFSDVMVLTRKGRSKNAACSHIAKNPEKYLKRYPREPKTIHRQFIRAKREFERDWINQLLGAEAVERAIAKYSSESERTRSRITPSPDNKNENKTSTH